MIETTCSICGRPFTPTLDDDLVDPDADHVCPGCRAGESGDELQGISRPDDPVGVGMRGWLADG